MQYGSFFACRDQTENPPPLPIVCVFHSLVCPTAFRQQIPARRERRTPRCPARRTSPRSMSGRSRSWRWRWRKVSVCVIEEASKMKQQTDHRFSLFQPFCVFAIFRALSFFFTSSSSPPACVCHHQPLSLALFLPKEPTCCVQRSVRSRALRNPLAACSSPANVFVLAFGRHVSNGSDPSVIPPLSRSVPPHLHQRRHAAGEEGPEELQE